MSATVMWPVLFHASAGVAMDATRENTNPRTRFFKISCLSSFFMVTTLFRLGCGCNSFVSRRHVLYFFREWNLPVDWFAGFWVSDVKFGGDEEEPRGFGVGRAVHFVADNGVIHFGQVNSYLMF